MQWANHVCALGRLTVLVSTWCIVNSRGPWDPVDPESQTQTFEYQINKMGTIPKQQNTFLPNYIKNKIPCSALNPCRGTRELPVTNCSKRARFSSSKSSTAFQNHLTMLVSLEQCFNRVCDFQSSISILPKPLIINCKDNYQ